MKPVDLLSPVGLCPYVHIKTDDESGDDDFAFRGILNVAVNSKYLAHPAVISTDSELSMRRRHQQSLVNRCRVPCGPGRP